MGMFDKLKQKATKAASNHPDKVSRGLDKAGDVVDKRTGGKHSGQIDSGVDKAERALGVDSSGPSPGAESPGQPQGQSGQSQGQSRGRHAAGSESGRPGEGRRDGDENR